MAHALLAAPTPSLVSDTGGSIAMAWVGERVLFARFQGSISAELARAHAARFDAMTAKASGIAYFSDGSTLTRYDLLVRSAFARFVMARPGLFRSITLLAVDPSVRRVLEPLSQTLSDLVEVTNDPDDFEVRLLSEAPFALTAPFFQTERRPARDRGPVPLRSSLRPKHPYR
jgi:hypothetical protein